MRIAGIQGLSLIDFPGNISAVLFVAGCDFRCPFCQNPGLVKIDPQLPQMEWREVLDFLQNRRKMLDGVTITGGEPLAFPAIVDFLERLQKEIGLPIKIDTNGNHPDILARLIEQSLVQYIAMDVKTAPSRYSEAAGTLVNLHHIEESVEAIKSSGIAYEFRTTVVPGLVDDASIDEMGRSLQGAKLWAFQQYQNRVVLEETYQERKPYPPDKVRSLALRAQPYAEKVIVRGL